MSRHHHHHKSSSITTLWGADGWSFVLYVYRLLVDNPLKKVAVFHFIAFALIFLFIYGSQQLTLIDIGVYV